MPETFQANTSRERFQDLAPPVLAKVDGWPINIAHQQQAICEIIAMAKRGESFAVFPLNMDVLVKLRHLSNFRRAFSRARLVTADGAPVVSLASKQDLRIRKTTGADLVVPLADAAAKGDISVYFFGTSSSTLGRVAAKLAQQTNFSLSVAGTEAPEQGFDPEGAAADAAIDRIAASGAQLCFLALGAPKQEIFAARAIDRGVRVGFVCVGAALDFLVGTQIRAPKMFQTCGLEWFWRLATDPRRLALRYARCAILLVELALTNSAGGRQDRPSSA